MSWLQTVSWPVLFIFAQVKDIFVTIERRAIVASSCLLSNLLDCVSLASHYASILWCMLAVFSSPRVACEIVLFSLWHAFKHFFFFSSRFVWCFDRLVYVAHRELLFLDPAAPI